MKVKYLGIVMAGMLLPMVEKFSTNELFVY